MRPIAIKYRGLAHQALFRWPVTNCEITDKEVTQMEPTQDELTLTEEQQEKPQEIPLDPQQEQLWQMMRELKEEQENNRKSSGGILLTFLIVLLVIVGMADLALASYIGFYYMNVGKTQYSYVENVPQNQEAGTTNEPAAQQP